LIMDARMNAIISAKNNMIFGFSGMPREGKSELMSIMAEVLHLQTHQPILANYTLMDSQRFIKFKDISEETDVIIAWDEVHHSMDARNFKDTKSMAYTQWLSIISHFRTTLFYTCQHPDQIDKRLRFLTDYMFFVDGGLRTSTINVTVVNWMYGIIVGRFRVYNKEKYYPLYNAFEIIKPTTMDQPIETPKFRNYKGKTKIITEE